MLKGLQYVGNGHGLSVMLFKSYKSVTVTWDRPYHFTQRDNISDEAKKYYLKNYRPLGIKLIEERDADTEPDQVKDETPVETPVEIPKTPVETNVVESGEETTETPEITADEVDSAETSSETQDETPVEESADKAKEITIDSVVKSVVEEYGKEVIESASVGDLGEIIDAKFDEDLIKELCSKVDYNYGRTRNKSKIISGLLEEKLADVVAYFLA